MDGLVAVPQETPNLDFQFVWSPAVRTTPAQATDGHLRLSIGGEVIWPPDGDQMGFRWTWIELLEFLANCWPELYWQEGFPFGLPPASPTAVRDRVRTRSAFVAERDATGALETLDAFQETHDLSRAVGGAALPSVWVVREGRLAWVATEKTVARMPAAELFSSLEAVGTEIAGRLHGHDDPRAHKALSSWQERTRVPVSAFIEVATGMSREALRQVQGDLPPTKAWDLSPRQPAVNELIAAARMTASLPTTEVASIIAAIRSVPGRDTGVADRLSADVMDVLSSHEDARPYEQGQAVATWLRNHASVGAGTEGRVDPSAVLHRVRVEVLELTLETAEVDAVACWGPSHGPAVLLNLRGRHNQSLGGRRATLAHELGHVLMDRATFLPLVEVLGGAASPVAEARARAFAAEFLLPRGAAGPIMEGFASHPIRGLRSLQSRFGVSAEVAAWQAKNSDSPLPENVLTVLRNQVSRPWQFG